MQNGKGILLIILIYFTSCILLDNDINGLILNEEDNQEFEKLIIENKFEKNENFFDKRNLTGNKGFFDWMWNPTLTDDDETFDDQEICLSSVEHVKNIFKDVLNLKKGTLKRLRFVIGKCNPVLIVPGLMASRLKVKIDCGKLKKNEPRTVELLGKYCPSFNVCPNSEVNAYVLWPSVLSDFSMLKSNQNAKKYFDIKDANSCLAFFMQFYNTDSSCPTIEKDSKKIIACRHSPHVKIVPYGLDSPTQLSNSCGFGAVNDIIYSKSLIEKVLNNSKTPQGFSSITANLVSKGYSRGFSLAALPYDFKEAECENKYFAESFNKVINMLYENTGKKVIIISHSYGNLNVNYQLSYHIENSQLKGKIKHLINIAGPLTGTFKSEQLLASGSRELLMFNKGGVVAGFERSEQSLIIPFARSSYQLRKYNINDILPEEEYKVLREAIKDRIQRENCEKEFELFDNNDEYCQVSDKFNELFKNELPFLNDKNICAMNKNWKKNYDSFSCKSENQIDETHPLYHPCHFHFLDYEKCPYVKITKDRLNYMSNAAKARLMCANTPKLEAFYFCSNEEKLRDSKRCGTNFVEKYISNPKNFPQKEVNFDGEDIYDYMSDIVKEFSNQCPKSSIHPDINTTFIFNKSFETKIAAFFTYDETTKLLSYPNKSDLIYSGGDGTVESESLMYPIFKILYDKQREKFKSKINLVDYCSPVNKSKFFDSSKDDINQLYTFLNCECRTDELYNTEKSNSDCNHASMLGDPNLVNYLSTLILSIGDEKEYENLNIKEIAKKIDQDNGYFPQKCNKIYEQIYKFEDK